MGLGIAEITRCVYRILDALVHFRTADVALHSLRYESIQARKGNRKGALCISYYCHC